MQNEELLTHLHALKHSINHEVAQLISGVIQEMKPAEPYFDQQDFYINASQSSGQEKVNIPFDARYMTVFNPTAATLYVAAGTPSNRPASAIPIASGKNISFSMQKTQVVTVYWSGTVQASTDTAVLQFSDHPLILQGM